MPRHGWAGIVALFLTGSLFADTVPEPAVNLEATLALQKALALARVHLRNDEPKKAVDVLEQNLAKVNGNPAYLELLRDAYRALIKDYFLKQQSALAQSYLQRLTILDPTALNDAALRPTAAPKFVPAVPATVQASMPLPDFAKTQALAAKPQIEVTPTTPPAATLAAAAAAAPRTVTARGKGDVPQDDPFDPSNRRSAATTPPAQLGELLARADQEFVRERYAQARHYYEQVIKLDQTNQPEVRDRLAYCMLDNVVQQLNGNASTPLAELRRQVRGALEMSPRLAGQANMLLHEIDQRSRIVAGSAPDTAAEPALKLQHYSRNPQGWHVTETTNFLIFHNQNRELIERVALIAERTRLAMGRKWFGNEGADWTPKCELVIHATAADYSRQTGVPATSPGHSRIETDPTSFRVIGRRIDLHTESLGFLEAVLPHETTHVVLAGNFGPHQVPRWADEGIAVLTEPLEKIEQHRRNLLRSQREGLLLPVRDLMQMQNYPAPRQIGAFYAESVMLVEFLAGQRGPAAFAEFVRDGLKDGYEPALQKNYGWTFADLQARWNEQVLGDLQKLASGR